MVVRLHFNGQGWLNQDLGVTAASGSGLTSYFISVNNSSHVYYLDANQNTNEAVFAGAMWYSLNLTQVYSKEYIYLDGRAVAIENRRY